MSRPTTFDELEQESKNNLGGFCGDYLAQKIYHHLLEEKTRINSVTKKKKTLFSVLLPKNKKESVIGGSLVAGTVAGTVLATTTQAKVGIALGGLALLGVGYYLRDKLTK